MTYEKEIEKLSVSVLKHTAKSLECLKTNDNKRALREAKNASFASKQLATILSLKLHNISIE
jgi:hypothetical protein